MKSIFQPARYRYETVLGSYTHSDMMTSATVVSGGDNDGEQVPEFDGTLLTFEVEDEEILDEDDDVGDLHAITEDDDDEDIEDTKHCLAGLLEIETAGFTGETSST